MDKYKNIHKVYNGFILLIFLNIFDGVCTYIGLKLGFYMEKNILLDGVFRQSDVMFLIIKILVPTVVLYILMLIVGLNITKTIKNIVYFANIIYSILFIYHIGLYSIVFNLALY